MITASDKEIAKQYAMDFCIPEQFGVCDNDPILYDTDVFGDTDKAAIDNGISKAVIIYEEENFVIKVPFNGLWGSDEFCPFSGADDSAYGNDYCRMDMIIIQDMQRNGFGSLAPDTQIFWGDDHRDFYIQEKVIPYCEGRYKFVPSKGSLNKVSTLSDKNKCANDEWLAKVIECYGIDFWNNFCKWVDISHPEVLSDMHFSNYGYHMDGTPVILDLSGFDY